VVTLSADLRDLASTCPVLPRSREFAPGESSSVQISLEPATDDPLGRAVAHLEAGDTQGAWTLARPLVGTQGGDAALIGGALALAADDLDGAITALEGLLSGPTVSQQPVGGYVVLAFSDEGMLCFDVNSIAGIALLVFAYAREGRIDDAVELAAQAHRVVGAESLLALQLQLLRDEKRWEELLGAANSADPSDNGRFEIAMLRGQALEELGRDAEAISIYADVANIDADFAWIDEARHRLERLGGNADSADLDDTVSGEHSLTSSYDPLRPAGLAGDRRCGPRPAGQPPTRASSAQLVRVDLSLGGYLDGYVSVRPISAVQANTPAGTWLEPLRDSPQPKLVTESSPQGRQHWVNETVETVLNRLDAAIDAEPRLVGLRRQPDHDEVAAKQWQRVLAALLAAAAGSDDSVERLADVLVSQDARMYVEELGQWCDAFISTYIGELSIATSGAAECLVLALAARLQADGDAEAARAWVSWAAETAQSPALQCAEVALAFTLGDDAHVVARTNGISGRDATTVVLQSYRARALQRTGSAETALVVLNDAVASAGRLGDDGTDLLFSVRYLRGRALLALGRTTEATSDFHAIEAVDADFLDVTELLSAPTAVKPVRREKLPERTRHEVWRRDEGRCVECGSQENLEFDHIIPWSKGGSDTARNLQLLCQTCNRHKSASI
jgi:tetratricopeptide (TPR) repeat protein